MVKEVKQLMIGILSFFKDDVPSMSFTSDIWSSRNNDSFVSLSVHFCTNKMELVHLVPYCAYFPVRHTGVNIKIKIDGMIEELNLNSPHLAKYIIHDNAANAKKAFECHDSLKQLFCLNHTLELALGDTTKEDICGMVVCKSMKKCNQLAVQVRKSPLLTEELRRACHRVDLNFTTLKPAVKTRWNSAHINISSVLRVKNALISLLADSEADIRWDEFEISSTEWKLLQGLELVLGKVVEVSKVRLCFQLFKILNNVEYFRSLKVILIQHVTLSSENSSSWTSS